MRFVQPVDQHALVVRLAAVDAEAEAGRLFREARMNLVQRIVAVDLRLAGAEEIEVGAGEDEDDGKFGQCPGFRLLGGALPLYGLLGKRQRRAQAVIAIILNGEPRQVREGSIADLVASLGLDRKSTR